ncbi:hypothetical protein ACFOUP_04585 [Belliella kenyensis]|uniref:Outer membrane protein beta-barrel domain-containing protein n=1 Tax=Belliella kenyensis TaxID=1472724 RepID=A0ABV8EHZ3_9BACT|nr:hypothetical protein [Belliella kenyensis]MCH7403442.1 hypothetical protein [Belliella kenyensis]MDN3602342.1 hypothetical protein [Belliella kenyensis]
MKKAITFILLLVSFPTFSQNLRTESALYDGIGIIGYVDQGAFINFTGPNINSTYKNSKFILGMLPSLRFKKDRNIPRNTFVTPNLGVGFTYSYKMAAIQVPLYYNPKTATHNGEWNIGIGLGLRIEKWSK